MKGKRKIFGLNYLVKNDLLVGGRVVIGGTQTSPVTTHNKTGNLGLPGGDDPDSAYDSDC